MKLDILDKTGKAAGTLTLDESVFGVTPNMVTVAQYVRVFTANQRQGTSSAKTRGEVSGGGKKPWAQKKTGRSRQGSTRSPIWRHGGVSHGPKPKSWNITLPKKVKRLALVSVLSKKAADKKILILDDLKIKEPKTADFKKIIDSLKLTEKRLLVVLDENDLNIRKSAANISGVSTTLVDNMNAYELLLANQVLFLKNAIVKVQDKYKLEK